MTPSEFKEKWTKGEFLTVPLPRERTRELGLSASTVEFLAESGLPEDAAPMLSFIADTPAAAEETIPLREQLNFLGPAFDPYVLIGSDGDGNPIAINTAHQDRVDWLDHEDQFRAHYMNASVESLSACLLAYRTFVETIIAENGEDAYLDAHFSDAHFNTLKSQIQQADSLALQQGFWKDELETLHANRLVYRPKPWWKFW